MDYWHRRLGTDLGLIFAVGYVTFSMAMDYLSGRVSLYSASSVVVFFA
jgi:hypothetical protein